MGTSLSSVLTLLPAVMVVLGALATALVIARIDNRNERMRELARRLGTRSGGVRRPPPRALAPDSRAAATQPRGHQLPTRWLPYLIFGLLPAWWALGLSFFQWPLIVAPMILPLCRWGGLGVPRRFGIWLAFIGWTVLSAVELHSGSRAIAWVWRESFYIASTVLFLYIYNSSERRLPTRAVVNALALFWVFVVVGGWFGVLFPTVSLASPAEHVFPKSLLHNTYFYAHVHLQFAEVQHFLGFREGRPQAFFAYTNAWGSTFAMLTPFALGALSVARRGLWRRTLQATLAASIVPAVFSLDRGMWLSLGVGLGYAVIRLAARRDVQMVAKVVTIVALALLVIVVSPLGGLVAGRFSHQTGDSSRLARDQVAQAQITANPILGYGAPQQATTLTHTQKSVGTESEVFLLLYSHGVPGLFFCAVWLAYTVFRSGRTRRGDSPLIFWTHVALLTACVQVPFYELTERMPVLFAAAALLHRRIRQAERQPLPPTPQTLQRPAPIPPTMPAAAAAG